MNTFTLILCGILAVGALCVPLYLARRKGGDSKQAVRSIKVNLLMFGLAAFVFLAFPVISFAANSPNAPEGDTPAVQMTSEETPASQNNAGNGLGYIAAAVATGIACLGAGIAVGGAAPAAIGAVTEDPKSFGKAMIFVVLGEGVAIYGMLISIMILNKL